MVERVFPCQPRPKSTELRLPADLLRILEETVALLVIGREGIDKLLTLLQLCVGVNRPAAQTEKTLSCAGVSVWGAGLNWLDPKMLTDGILP